jgi:hypothetical protein
MQPYFACPPTSSLIPNDWRAVIGLGEPIRGCGIDSTGAIDYAAEAPSATMTTPGRVIPAWPG